MSEFSKLRSLVCSLASDAKKAEAIAGLNFQLALFQRYMNQDAVYVGVVHAGEERIAVGQRIERDGSGSGIESGEAKIWRGDRSRQNMMMIEGMIMRTFALQFEANGAAEKLMATAALDLVMAVLDAALEMLFECTRDENTLQFIHGLEKDVYGVNAGKVKADIGGLTLKHMKRVKRLCRKAA
jgi:hypothetical protein